MNSIAELVAAYQADKLKLAAVFEAIDARGALPEADYRAECNWLAQQRDTGALDPLIAKAFLAKLATVQAPPAAHDDDVTMVKPATQRPPLPPSPPAGAADDEAHRVQPTSRPAPPVDEADDVTVVKPTSRPMPPPVADRKSVV